MKLTEEMMELNINEIRSNPEQVRTYFDEGKLQILVDSIKEIGVNTPIQLVWDCRDDGKKATIKDGERRFRALKRAGFTKLKYGDEYIIVEEAQEDLGFKGLIANCMGEGLQPAEKGKALMELLKRRGIKNSDMAINVIGRAKDYIENNFIAEPNTRNYYIPTETVKQVAKDMKTIGVSGTYALDLIKILRLPKDIRNKIVFSSPNVKITKEKVKMNRFGDMVARARNDRGNVIPVLFARELVRLNNEKMVRFFLKKAFENRWTGHKLNSMVTDYLGSNMTPERYIDVFSPEGVRVTQKRVEEIDHFIKSMDTYSATLTSFRVINLFSMSDQFKQKMFLVSGMGLRSSIIKLKDSLEHLLFTAKEISKLEKEERKDILKLPFRVSLNTVESRKSAYRFSIPISIGRKIEKEIGDFEGAEVELQINAIIQREKKMTNLTFPMPICKACNQTIDVKDGIKEIQTPFGEREFYHTTCKSEWEKGSEFYNEILNEQNIKGSE